MIINKKRSKKIYILAAIAAVLAVTAIYFVVAFAVKLPPFFESSESPKFGEQKVSLERSDAEKSATKSLEDNPELKTQNNQNDVPSTPNESSSGKTAVNVLVTNAAISNGTVSASGFVTNIVEEGGTCAYVFVNGTQEVTKSSGTLPNSTSTTCETVRFPASELTANGEWKVVIKYSSPSAAGISEEARFTK